MKNTEHAVCLIFCSEKEKKTYSCLLFNEVLDPVSISVSPFPPIACSSFRWSTVICRISAFSSLEEPWKGQWATFCSVTSDFMKLIYSLCHWNITHFLDFHFVSIYLFFKSTGHQSPELWQAVVDPVSAPLLYDLQNEKSRGTTGTKQNNRTKRTEIQGYNPLTPLLFFRARICEALPGDMDPVTGLYREDTVKERQRWGRWGDGTEKNMLTLILLHIVIITLLNMTQKQDGTSTSSI